MKINLLSLVPLAVSSAPLDDSSTLLAMSTQSATATNLMNAVALRNVTKMEAFVQELADESVNEPGWKFDADIQAALKAIKDMFVKSIQLAIKDQHKADQEHMNCFTEECFGGCMADYRKMVGHCNSMESKCAGLGHAHHECRVTVYSKYKTMAQKCGELHCFDVPDPVCNGEDCLCPALDYCHRAGGDATCEARAGECSGKYGNWLQQMIAKYDGAYTEWKGLYVDCKQGYHEFLNVDLECDKTQKEFERCLCQRNSCAANACNIDYDQCEAKCWDLYVEHVQQKECLEKDRKIDWSATKKIECYIDVLLHDYTESELLTKCGTNDCINKAREEDYKHCATICPQIDHEGHWPQVHSVDPVKIAGHGKREAKDEFHLGDGEFKCDANGEAVFTKHRGGVTREGEARCTEHLDIDYQVPQCSACEDPPPPVCDAAFHQTWYAKYDDTSKIGCISDCCPDDGSKSCFDPQQLLTSYDGKEFTKITIQEHSHAWAYNRCPCQECTGGTPVYPGRPKGRECGMGVHTISPAKGSSYVPEAVDKNNDYSYQCIVGGDVKTTFALYDANTLSSEQSAKVEETWPGKPATYYACRQGCAGAYPSSDFTCKKTSLNGRWPKGSSYLPEAVDKNNDYSYQCIVGGDVKTTFVLYDANTLTSEQSAKVEETWPGKPATYYACLQGCAAAYPSSGFTCKKASLNGRWR